MHSTYAAFSLIPLTFNPQAQPVDWQRDDALAVQPVDPLQYQRQRRVLRRAIRRLSSPACPLTASPPSAVLSAQQDFFVQPYVYSANAVMTTFPQTSRMALSNVTINAGSTPLTLSDDYFVGNNTMSGST